MPQAIWERCQLLQLCSPGNPTGAVMTIAQMQHAVHLADQYDFVIASDECYSDIYLDESKPPPGLLEACKAMDRHDYDRCVVFHSLSKRSNLPGLRSGFVAGDKAILSQFLNYRTYPRLQYVFTCTNCLHSSVERRDSYHRKQNPLPRKILAVTDILRGCMTFPEPQASFYLWAETPIDDQQFAKQLYSQQNVTYYQVNFYPGQPLTQIQD